ncbi:MAG: fasciclin domain-containing protein [Pseudomonadales bacterium]|nr:fasciclin domain-containing protein [Pseudomonadales bacterium]
MNLKKLILASTTALAFTFGAASHAQTSLANCVATPITTFDGNIVDAALATPELSVLVDAILAAGLQDALASAENITVYAPTNDAFAKIPADITAAILADVDVLTTVLTYHVSPGAQDPRVFVPAVRRDTLSGQSVYFFRYGGWARVNNAAVNCAGIQTDNGLVWLIESVLLPQF